MVPVRGVDDVLVLLVAAVDLRDDIVRLHLTHVDPDVEIRFRLDGDRLEVFPRRPCLE